MPKLAARTFAALAVLVLLIVGLWLATREPTVPERRDSAGGAPLAPAAPSGELAAAPGNDRVAAAADRTATTSVADAVDVLRGRVLLVRDGVDEPYTGSGFVTFTRRGADGVPSALDVRVTGGAFELARLAEGEALALERVLIGEGKSLGAVDVVEAPVVDHATTDPCVRVAPFLTLPIHVFEASSRRALDDAEVRAGAPREPVALRSFGGGLFDVQVPIGVAELFVGAPGCVTQRVLLPGGTCRSAIEVALRSAGRLEITFLQLDPARTYRVEFAAHVDDPTTLPVPIEVRGDETRRAVEGIGTEPVAVTLFESSTGSELDSRVALFDDGVARVALSGRPVVDERLATFTVEGRVDPRRFETFTVWVTEVDPRRSVMAAIATGATYAMPSHLRLVVTPDPATGEFEHSVGGLRPGLRSVRVDDGLRVGDAFVVLESGATTRTSVEELTFVDITLRCLDALTGELVRPGIINATRLPPDVVSTTIRGPKKPEAVSARVPPGRIELLVAYTGVGGSRTSWFGPFDVAGGETFDLVLDGQPKRIVGLQGVPMDLELMSWWRSFGLRDAAGDAISLERAALKFGMGSAENSGVHFQFDSGTPRVYVSPPPHPSLGALASGWVEFDALGLATFELVPLVTDR
jgi:hypothetical protein